MSTDEWNIIYTALRVVGVVSTLNNDLCILLTKIVHARPEVDDLLDQVQGLAALINEIAKVLRARQEDRQNDSEVTPDELAAENRLYGALCDCRIRLREMKTAFQPLQDISGEVSIVQMRDVLKPDPNIDFFNKQQDRIEWQHRTLSLALQMLGFHLSRGDQARRDADKAHFIQLANLLQECRELPPEGPPSGPVSPKPEVDEEPEAVLESVGETDMPAPDHCYSGGSGAGDYLIDRPISGAGEPSFRLAGSPREAVLSDHLVTVVKMKNPETQIRRVKALLKSSPPDEICVRDDDDWTLLHHAVLQENVPLMKLLLRQPEICDAVYLNARNSSGHTALMEAGKRAYHERGSKVAHLLLEQDKCELNLTDDSDQRRSALYFVVERPANDYSISVANALLTRKADVMPIFKGLPLKKGFPEVNKAIEGVKKRRKEGRGSFSDKFFGNVLH